MRTPATVEHAGSAIMPGLFPSDTPFRGDSVCFPNHVAFRTLPDAGHPTPSLRQPLSTATQCRACEVRCDLVVYPSACLAIGCPNLYSYDGPGGRRFVGCIERVFRSEIDLGLLEAALETSSGFGALRCVRPPLKQCSTAIDRAYEHRADVL